MPPRAEMDCIFAQLSNAERLTSEGLVATLTFSSDLAQMAVDRPTANPNYFARDLFHGLDA